MERNVFRPDASYVLQRLIEGNELEKWQKYFCDVTDIFVCCIDGKGKALTKFGGNPDEAGRVLKAIDREQLRNLRLSQSSHGGDYGQA